MDPTAFYAVEEFEDACRMLGLLCERRARSVRRQLEGGLSTRNLAQAARDKVDASDVDLARLGLAF